MSTLDNYRKEARRWLRALRALDSAARDRLRRAYPRAPAEPSLRDVQQALARERGHRSWAELKASIPERGQARTGPPAGGRTHDERVATFLQFACWDTHVHGKADHRMYDRAAGRLLEEHPEIARDSLYTAIVAGDLEHVERTVAEQPDAAREPGGSRGWTPLLYLCFTRFTRRPTADHAPAIARRLLDAGANPNDFYMAGDSKYSALVGAAGEGEQDAPRQPQAPALFALLLERGAGPYDIQVLYNTHFSCDMIWWLELTYRYALATGRKADWDDPDWPMLGMGGYGPGAYFILNAAVEHNHLALAEWALSHGARPDPPPAYHRKFRPHNLYDAARIQGLDDMADLLRRYGVEGVALEIEPEMEFVRACLRLDRAAASRILEAHPEYRQSPVALFTAARRDRADAIALLLDLGVPLEIEDEHRQHALHEAAGHNALRAAAYLIERGAEIDPKETRWQATPIGFASYGNRIEMVDLLSRYSRHIWTLTFRGHVERLRDLLDEDPALAKQTDSEGCTPLWWLPDDEAKALEIAELFISKGTNPSLRLKGGGTAADWALKRGMLKAARRLGLETVTPAPPPASAAQQRYERLAEDLLFAFESGHAAALDRLARHYGNAVAWQDLRTLARQRLAAAPEAERPGGYFALPHARLLVAREAGFDNWAALERALTQPLSETPPPVVTASRSAGVDPAARMIQPVEMSVSLPITLRGTRTTTTDVWNMLTACLDGDLERVTSLVAGSPALVVCDHNYMSPLHLAVREGHVPLARYLIGQGAANPNYVTYPYRESLVTLALDREYGELAGLLERAYAEADRNRPEDEGGEIDYGMDDEQRRFQKLLNTDAVAEIEPMLEKRPELAVNPFTFWGEGPMSMPANRRHRRVLELLLRHGARVPDVCKWAPEYYFKHLDIGAFLLEAGMAVDTMNHHRTTLLHSIACKGDVARATLLLDRGANIDAIDEEFRSTPLGFAARFGCQEIVRLLLERGADPNLSGAPWSTPLEWARKKGHPDIQNDLKSARARS